MNPSRDRALIIGAVIVAALLIFGKAVAYWNIAQLRDDTEWVIHTLEVLDLSGDVTRRIIDTEVSMRGYVMTGDPDFLTPYDAARPKIDSLFAELTEKVKDNPPQRARIARMKRAADETLKLNEWAIKLRDTDAEAAREIVAERRTKIQLDEIRKQVNEFQRIERELLVKREADSGTTYRTANTFLAFNLALGLSGIAGFVWMIRREIATTRAAGEAIQRQAEELAKSNAELEQFAYVASHDLQEPLRAVSGCVQILQKRYGDKLDSGADELIGHTVDGAARMQKLINDLLAYSRITTRGKELLPISAAEAVKHALRNLEVSMRERNAEVIVEALPRVRADETQLALLFQNLIGNGLKFTKVPPKIKITARRDGGEWMFGVADNGIGIAPEYFERIFGVFQRLHTRDEYPGTGIGLSICRKIVERHGGRMWLESQPGAGTTFYFTLPAEGTVE